MGDVLELTRQALWLTLILSGPPVGAAALVGLLVAFLQAATQLQEQTFAYALKFLAIVIAIQQQSGGNLAEALSNLSGVLRERFKMQMKVKALSAEAKASAMILAALPPGVMFMVKASSPEYISPLFDTRTGNLFILIGLAWMSIGIMVMRKMINFKF